VYDEHSHILQIYWSGRDVLTWLAENSDDEHLKKVKENAEQHAVKMEVASRSIHDEKALFDEDDGDDEIVLGRDNVEVEEEEVESVQREISKTKVTPEFEGLKTTPAGHKIQQIKELMTVPVRVSPWCSHLVCFADLLSVGNCHCRLDKKPACHQSLQRESLCRAEGVGEAGTLFQLEPLVVFVQYIVVRVGVHRSSFIRQSLSRPSLLITMLSSSTFIRFLHFCSCNLGGVCSPPAWNMAGVTFRSQR
jgi:hypothetical protein